LFDWLRLEEKALLIPRGLDRVGRVLFGRGGRDPGWGLAATLIVFACLLAVPALARAEERTYVVDSTADEAAASPGSETCLSAAGKCTLRAAIEESNATLGEKDKIEFDEAVFDGQTGSTIILGASLPKIVDRVLIEGHICMTAAGVEGPCVAIEGPSSGPALSVEVEEVEIEGLAVTGAEVGIDVLQASPEFVAARDWLGIALDGSSAPNQTGLFLGPGSSRSRIGSEGADFRNVFGNNTVVALEIDGSSRVKVLGNYVGVGPGGAAPAPNGAGIRVVSSPSTPAEAVRIGTRLGPIAAATPACDGGCNVIADSHTGVLVIGRVSGEGQPAEPTRVLANYVGLDAAGDTALPGAGAGIFVDEGATVTVGGARESEANRIAGGAVGVLGVAASNLLVLGNRIGLAAGVTEAAAEPGVGIRVEGPGATVSRNQIVGAETGILSRGSLLLGFEGENLIDGNSIEASRGDGILLENNFNTVTGNVISSSGGDGVHVVGSQPFGIAENAIGGDSAGEENAISGSGGAAVEIADTENSFNEVARNRGAGNRGPFIHLVALPNEKGPNKGIRPPAFTTVSGGIAAGTADPLATVRLFRKAGAEPGEVESFIGQAPADALGHWQLGFPALPPGTTIGATQTDLGGTSELAMATTPKAVPAAAPPSRATAPETFLLHGPRHRWHHRTARFRFASDEAAATFECRFDHQRFRGCRSPRAYRHLRPGRHLFEVRAVAADGEFDPTPARRQFTVLRRR
jgi:CSLREA domain-containing protein